MRNDKLLLDTHVFLWWMADHPKLRKPARAAIVRAGLIMVSAASAWEAAIKASLGRLSMPVSFERGVEQAGFEKLPITFSHAEFAARLPPHHQDPFDRMLIAQAILENLVLVTGDRRLAGYQANVLVV